MQDTLEIKIAEPAFAPAIYLQTNNSLDDLPASQLKAGRIHLGFEGNTTIKEIGILFVCDPNKDDKIELLTQGLDGNVTYDMVEMETNSPPQLHSNDSLQNVCLAANLR